MGLAGKIIEAGVVLDPGAFSIPRRRKPHEVSVHHMAALVAFAAIGILSLLGLAGILLVMMGDREQDIYDEPQTLDVQNHIGDR